ncbi:unnamed protein product [marine sediment metagenome]|uniref:Uncharacterized protein n=1 Tax=marine sediment metagenome TaxID=412755 RepID=X1BQS2_9ZZZZ
MALFLQKYYKGECIGVNDIGAINYYADIDCLDLWGLSNVEVAIAKLSRTWDTEMISNITKENTC